MQRKDYYGILGITRDAEQGEVKKAYRKLAFQFHPDTNEGDPKAEDKFKEINEAYDVLGDMEKRNLYDLGHDPMSQGAPFRRSPFGPHADSFEQAFFGNFGCRGGGFGRGLGRGLGRGFGRGRGRFCGNFSSPFVGSRFQEPKISAQSIILTSAEAQSGAERAINLHTGSDILTITITLPTSIHDGALLKLDGTQAGHQGLDVYLKVKVVD